MRKVGQPIHLQLKGNGNLALHLLGGAARPLGNDIDVIVGNVRIGLNREPVKRDDSPDEQQDAETQDQELLAQGEIDKVANHRYWVIDSSGHWVIVWMSFNDSMTRWLNESIFSLHPRGTGELQGVGNHFSARGEAAQDNLISAGSYRARLHFQAAKAVSSQRDEDPILIVQTHNGRGGNRGLQVFRPRAEGGGGKHPSAHQAAPGWQAPSGLWPCASRGRAPC